MNQLTQVKTGSTPERKFSYGAQGARIGEDSDADDDTDYDLIYDPFGNLIEVKYDSVTIYTAEYDAFGRRFRWSDGTNAYFFLYDGAVPFAEFNNAGTLQRRIFWGQTGPICMRQSGNRWFIADKFGNTRALVDDDGAVTDYHAYDAWCGLVGEKSSVSSYNPFRWNGSSGYQYISNPGMYHAGARTYDPTVGRWLQRDPIEMAGGHPNLYVYAGNNPVDSRDPSGMREATVAPSWAGLITEDGPGADLAALADEVRFQNRDWIENTGDFVAGMGDTLTRGGTKLFRIAIGADWSVNEDSWFYHGGEVAGTGLELAVGAGVATKAAGYAGKLAMHRPHHGMDWHLQFHWW